MAGGECRRGAFAAFLREFHKTAEEAFMTARVDEFCMGAEIVAKHGEMACCYLIGTYGLEIELRTCHGQEEVDAIVEEEGGHDDEGRLFKKPPTAKQGSHDGDGNHGVIGEIAHVKEFAPCFGIQHVRKLQAGLAIEESVVGIGKEKVLVGEKLAKLKGVRIPKAQKRKRKEITQEACTLGRQAPMEEIEGSDAGKDEDALEEQSAWMEHITPKDEDEYESQQRIGYRHLFNGQELTLGLFVKFPCIIKFIF